MRKLMHFTDPNELGGLHVIGRNDVTLGVVMLHKCAVSPTNQMR